jgi:hypothetical protein
MQQVGYRFEHQAAPLAGISYAYRPLKFMEFEAGVDVALHPGAEECTQYGCYDPKDRYTRVPFGVRFLVPAAAGRVELFAGGGGLYQQYSIANPSYSQFTSRSNWGEYALAGVGIALDRRRRFWAGVTPRGILANPRESGKRWFTITGDLSFRF